MQVVDDLDRETPDPAAWDSFVAASPDGHLLQTSRWGILKTRFGWTVERVALINGNTIVAGAQVLYRSSPFGLTLAYVPKGPVVDWNDEQVVVALLTALRQATRRHRVFCTKLEPDLLNAPESARYGLRPSPQSVQPRSTILIDLRRGEDEILSEMKPQTRYNIRLAMRKGAVVRGGTTNDLPLFQNLIAATGQRDRFAVYGADYYRAAYDLFVPSGHARLFLAMWQENVNAGILVFVVGHKAWYMYGASSDAHRNLMPNHLLQWEAMRWARARGCATYDLWGISDQVGENPDRYAHTTTKRTDGLWGVYSFKRGFGGRIAYYLGAFDDVCSHSTYWPFNRVISLLERIWGETWHRRVRAG